MCGRTGPNLSRERDYGNPSDPTPEALGAAAPGKEGNGASEWGRRALSPSLGSQFKALSVRVKLATREAPEPGPGPE